MCIVSYINSEVIIIATQSLSLKLHKKKEQTNLIIKFVLRFCLP